MRLRPFLTIGCALAVATATVATAAPKAAPKPKPLCNLVVDPANDLVPGRPYDPSLDIISADVANNATTVTAVIRLAKLTAEDLMAPTGRYYALAFIYKSTAAGSDTFSAALTPTGNLFVGGNGTGVVDLKKSEIRISMPISRMVGHPLFKAGDALMKIHANSDLSTPVYPDPTGTMTRVVLNATNDTLGDRASSEKEYPVGAPSCVKVGA